MLTKMRNHKGFTLIELMIVVAIIGILAAIAIPNFMRFQAKSKQSEARTILSGIFTAETAYFAEENVYGSSEHNIGFTPASAAKYYTSRAILVTGTSRNRFTATASGNIDTDASRDIWEINETDREPNNSTNDVTAG